MSNLLTSARFGNYKITVEENGGGKDQFVYIPIFTVMRDEDKLRFVVGWGENVLSFAIEPRIKKKRGKK